MYAKAPSDLKSFVRAKTADLIRPLPRSTPHVLLLLQNTPKGTEQAHLHALLNGATGLKATAIDNHTYIHTSVRALAH